MTLFYFYYHYVATLKFPWYLKKKYMQIKNLNILEVERKIFIYDCPLGPRESLFK